MLYNISKFLKRGGGKNPQFFFKRHLHKNNVSWGGERIRVG